jgi:hypothetical protein
MMPFIHPFIPLRGESDVKTKKKNNIKNYEQEIRRTFPTQPFASEQGSVGKMG